MREKEVKSSFGKPTPLGEVLESFLKKRAFFAGTYFYFTFSLWRMVSSVS